MLEAKKVIRQILLIYLTTTGIFLIIFFSLWYDKLKDELIVSKTNPLREIHRNIITSILNSRFTPIEQSAKNIATSSNFLNFAIFNKDKVFFNNLTFHFNPSDFKKGAKKRRLKGILENKVFILAPMNFNDYFLNHINLDAENSNQNTDDELQIIIQGDDIMKDLFLIRIKVFGFALLAFILLGVIAYFLVRISLKPLEDKINTLNRFIKDSTHEINTPLSVILMSIEQLEKQNIFDSNTKFSRIKLAAKTLNQVYSDLVFSNFSHTLKGEKEELLLKDLILERLEYFKAFFEQKKIELRSDLNQKSTLFASKIEISKLFDNLLSNAIKYNKKGGKIIIELKENSLKISDNGCGIAKENLKNIFERYTRFNTDQGGFGIGLSLVKRICDENKITISCTSNENQGSTFTLEW